MRRRRGRKRRKRIPRRKRRRARTIFKGGEPAGPPAAFATGATQIPDSW